MLLRWGRGLPFGSGSAGDVAAFSWVSFFWRSLGVLVLGVLLAKWTWVLFAPHAMAVRVEPQRGAAMETGQLFGVVVAPAAPAPEVAAMPDVRLAGVFAAKAGRPGFAVLKLDGSRQLGVALGGSVAPGVKLLEVHPDHVLLERAGVRQRVDLEGKGAGVAGVGVAPAR